MNIVQSDNSSEENHEDIVNFNEPNEGEGEEDLVQVNEAPDENVQGLISQEELKKRLQLLMNPMNLDAVFVTRGNQACA